MLTQLDQVSAGDLGERLRIARELIGITQAKTAASIGMARTTLVAIEQGVRRIRMNELLQFARLYGTSVNALIREESIHVDFAPRFRKLNDSKDDSLNVAVNLMVGLTRAEVELENLLGVKRIQNYPPERPILPGDVRTQAEQNAQEFRQHLGLGIGPVTNIVTLLEFELGVRVYIRKIDSKISGLFAFDNKIGPCMLLNANHPRERRNQSAAHECGHFISTRKEPEVLCQDEKDKTREEHYASAFGIAFLTPARAVMQKFHEVTAGADRLTRRHVIVLAHFFSVSREAMIRRLEELKLTKRGTFDWFQNNGGITDKQAEQVLGSLAVPDFPKADAERPTTLRLNMLASEAYGRDLLSEGQLARLLHLDRVEMREILDNMEVGGGEADGVTNLPY